MDYIEAANAALARRANLAEQRKAVLDDVNLTDAAKRERWEALDKDINALAEDAKRYFNAAEQDAEIRALNEKAGALTAGGREKRQGAPVERDEAQELRDLARGKREFVDFDLRTAQSGVAANAGNTKKTTFVAEVLEAMRERSAFMGRARTITTSGGEVMEWPIKNGLNPATAPVQGTVGIVAENTAYGKADQSWSKTSLGAYKFGTIVEATQEIVDDSELPILSILGQDAGETVADLVTAQLLRGTGTGQPWGWITRATASGVTAASLAAVTFDNLIDLQYSLTQSYRARGVYMVNDAAIPTLRKLKDADGRYLWQPSVVAGIEDTLHGKPLITDINVPTAGLSAKVVLFGDPNKYLIRQVKQLRVTRSDEYGWDRDVIAFKVSWRGSGDLFDLNSVKAITLPAS